MPTAPDVHDFMVLKSPRPTALPAVERDTNLTPRPWMSLDEAWSEDGEVAYADIHSAEQDRWVCVLCIGDEEIVVPVSSDQVGIRERAGYLEIRYTAADGTEVIKRVDGGAFLR